MRQRLLFVIAGVIAIAATGCASEETVTLSPSPAATAPAASPAPGQAAGQPNGKTQPFAQPLVAQKPAAQAVPGLIQPTNADERARQVQARINAQRTKKDPFSSLPPILPKPTAAPQRTANLPQPTSTQKVPTLPGAPQPGALPTIASTPPRPSSPFPPGRTAANPKTAANPNRPAARPVPPPPTTNLASAVEVSGVVHIDGKAQAIVRAPNEGTSRYVRVGQRLSDGQVLVKRIEMIAGSDPVVVLEENGVEVPKVVGEGGQQPQQAGGRSA
ncbi:hypothetical protein [Leptothermofonsia sp. ETS-13]|uniref:hypothetical protein n=1 Tax=Leptothermofonsia sp. ETS-13 TaxID=3035696 RepID=UPI003BA03191